MKIIDSEQDFHQLLRISGGQENPRPMNGGKKAK
jgi:hypothetical protein